MLTIIFNFFISDSRNLLRSKSTRRYTCAKGEVALTIKGPHGSVAPMGIVNIYGRCVDSSQVQSNDGKCYVSRERTVNQSVRDMLFVYRTSLLEIGDESVAGITNNRVEAVETVLRR